MLEDTTIHNAITDKALASYFRSSGNLLEEESAVLGQAVTNLMLSGDNVNNKNIILSLDHRLASNFIFYTFIIRCLHNDFIANLLNNQAVALFKKQPN